MKRLTSLALISLIAAGNISATHSVQIAEIVNNTNGFIIAEARDIDGDLRIAAGESLRCNLSINLSLPTIGPRLHPIAFTWCDRNGDRNSTFFLDFRKCKSLSGKTQKGIFLSTNGVVFSWTRIRSPRNHQPQPVYCIIFDKLANDKSDSNVIDCSIRALVVPSATLQ